MDEEYKYWAFVSYSHADERWAAWLHKALERYRVPKRLVGRETPTGRIPPRLFPVFRDRDELAGASSLGPELQNALRRSRALIAICSPRAARSRWVNEEIKYFKSLGRAGRVFALIVDGEPHALAKGDPELECFPETLRFHVNDRGDIVGGQAVEPIAADVRRHGDGKANATLKLISGVLGVGFDELRQRELQARNRRLGFVAALASGIAGLTIVLAVQAWLARADAERRQRQAEDLIQFMLGDLRQKLEPIGKLDILGAVGDKAMSHFAALDEQDLTDPVLQSRATALRQIGEVRMLQGDLAGASDAFQQALKLDAELVERHPRDANSRFNVAASQFSVGYAHYAKGEIELALPWFERQEQSVEQLVALEPDNDRWRMELGNANANLGALALQRGDYDEARQRYEAAREVHERLVARTPDDQEAILALATLHGWLNHLASLRRDYSTALTQARAKIALLRRLMALAPDNAEYRLRLAGGLQQAVYSQAALKPVDPAAPELLEAVQLTRGLRELDAGNIEYSRAHQISLTYLTEAELARGALRRARDFNGKSLALARMLFAKAPDSAEVFDDVLSVLTRTAKLAWLSSQPEAARALVREALDLPVSEKLKGESRPERWLELHLLGQWIAEDAHGRKRHAAEASAWLARMREAKAEPSAELLMRLHALNGEAAQAAQWAARLSEVERAHPYVAQFCQSYRCGL